MLIETPWSIAAGWMLFLVWGRMQLVWFRRARVVPAVAQPASPPPARTARPARKPKTVAPPVVAESLPAIDLDTVAEVAARSGSMLGL